jgi:uroporphyrin-III C-methyltransferase/precorrin-2 dehydrogenase/sirohydrochlorin ferrochelatase
MPTVFAQPNEAPARVAPLAVLPVFFALKGKPVVVAGGSDGAAWKAELLAATGALVHVYAPAEDVSEDFWRILAQSAGRFVHHDRAWSAEDLAGTALAVADLDAMEAEAFRTAARAAGVPVNIIDKPEACDFQFGTIVNRSPVVVGISTAGAAPILGQAIRRKIETLLPPSLAAWATLAQVVRARVGERLEGLARRAFWEALVDRAFGPAPTARAEAELVEAIDRVATTPARRGRVTLVGAGPGDAELLTLKAVRALQAADVILFDEEVSAEVLELARREAKRLLVGEHARLDTHALMIKLARRGKHVVRLVSGDPADMPDAITELTGLEAAGIPVAIVRGVACHLAAADPERHFVQETELTAAAS